VIVAVIRCTEPARLLGWLEMPLPVDGARSVELTFIADAVKGETADGAFFLATNGRVEFPVIRVLQHGAWHHAFRSDGTPIEVLRRIPGFVENKQV
jgi:hypothetical protein